VLFNGATPIAVRLASDDHPFGMLSDWDRRAGSWKPVIGWKPTALTGVK
jgi:hypothetical protein